MPRIVGQDMDGIPRYTDGQASERSNAGFQRWHLALVGMVGLDYRRAAEELHQRNERNDRAIAANHRERAAQWAALYTRMRDAVAGVPCRFSCGDLALVRWFAIVGIRDLYRRETADDRRLLREQADSLTTTLRLALDADERAKYAAACSTGLVP